MYILIKNKLILFKRFNDYLYSDNCHIYYNNYYEYNKKLLNYDENRLLINNNNLNNPRYLFLSLYRLNNKIKLGILNNKKHFKWIYNDNYIYYNKKYLNIENGELIISYNKTRWILLNNCLMNEEHKLFISSDLEYNLCLVKNIEDAIEFKIDTNIIFHTKSWIKINFERNNIKNNITISDINLVINNNLINTYNIGILLAGGLSSRFKSDTPKQIYILNNKPILTYSLDIFGPLLDNIIIVSNSKYYENIQKICYESVYKNKIKIVINDINDRIESINKAIEYISINYTNINKIIIHDVARPFISSELINEMLRLDNTIMYSQYYLKLTNGLAKYTNNELNFVNRDEYIEICTPICINYNILIFIFNNYMKINNSITNEFLLLIKLLKIKYFLIEGNYKYLRKITYVNDL